MGVGVEGGKSFAGGGSGSGSCGEGSGEGAGGWTSCGGGSCGGGGLELLFGSCVVSTTWALIGLSIMPLSNTNILSCNHDIASFLGYLSIMILRIEQGVANNYMYEK